MHGVLGIQIVNYGGRSKGTNNRIHRMYTLRSEWPAPTTHIHSGHHLAPRFIIHLIYALSFRMSMITWVTSLMHYPTPQGLLSTHCIYVFSRNYIFSDNYCLLCTVLSALCHLPSALCPPLFTPPSKYAKIWLSHYAGGCPLEPAPLSISYAWQACSAFQWCYQWSCISGSLGFSCIQSWERG